ncbi:hypothetical protein BC938DRAFT_476521 [Jimgerdemannia flammicorona]|uniref:Uncharacterized protein n=1 Tax=Jimgerdemannia flammicorona TaxID=994334 RepID=A0A433R0L5_9FUNG|nr:hypothetical protein BC938DRAFT_476521 [Jimgerdemannia flammicorona]
MCLPEFIDNRLGLKIPDLNAGSGSGAQPVAGVDDIPSLEGIQVLAFIEIPQHHDAILATRGAQRTIRRNGNSVNVASVPNVVRTELAFRKFPDLRTKMQDLEAVVNDVVTVTYAKYVCQRNELNVQSCQ